MDMYRGTAFNTHSEADEIAANAPRDPLANAPIGSVIEISGSSSQVRLDLSAVNKLADAGDPCLAMGGQVGSQIKVKVGSTWLMANLRTLKVDENREGSAIGCPSRRRPRRPSERSARQDPSPRRLISLWFALRAFSRTPKWVRDATGSPPGSGAACRVPAWWVDMPGRYRRWALADRSRRVPTATVRPCSPSLFR